MSHDEMRQPQEGFYAGLLQALMTRSGIASRRFAAASFLLRYGWSAGAVIAPLLMDKPIPWYAAEEADLCFADTTLFQAICLNSDGFIIAKEHRFSAHPQCVLSYSDPDAAIRLVADQLTGHAKLVVEALHEWSGFSHKALWAMVSSSWVGQILNISKRLQLPEDRLKWYLTRFYDPWRPLADSLPHWYFIREQEKNHYFHIRASCCLYFKGEKRHFCASCPVIQEAERAERNRQWVQKYG
ncbi:MAG: (2Fe-2S)-binding protein [Candidatus Contendobacter sp.]|nr:(2Fe-2S)-binding protein [Candidatus Contendobacter sp.]